MLRPYGTINSSKYQVLAFNLRINKPINEYESFSRLVSVDNKFSS